MPIYEYQCQACSKEIEVLQKISDAPLEVCPDCGEAGLRKKISAAAFRLKGSGWYETDFKTRDKKNLAGDGDKSENKSAPSTEKAASKDTSSAGDSKKSA